MTDIIRTSGDRVLENPVQGGNLILRTTAVGGAKTDLSMSPAGVITGLDARASVFSLSNANYTITNTDRYEVILVTTGGSNRTVTLPSAASNAGRRLIIKKVDSGAGAVVIDGAASETIDGLLESTISKQYAQQMIVCDGTGWHSLSIEGEYYTQSGGGTTAGNFTATTIASIALPIGSYEIGAHFYAYAGTSTTMAAGSYQQCSISPTNHALSGSILSTLYVFPAAGAFSSVAVMYGAIPKSRFRLTAAQSMHFVAQDVVSSGDRPTWNVAMFVKKVV